MRRLVVALTTLLALGGVGVVIAYLLVASAATDRTARAAPGDTALYLQVELQPSTAQRAQLFALIERLPGFRDPASLDGKLHDVAQQLLGEVGLDYASDVRPWLGSRLAVALTPSADDAATVDAVLMATVRDSAAARVAVPKLMARPGVSYAAETYRGRPVMVGSGIAYVLLDDLLVVADTRERIDAALDADADTVPSLADSVAFSSAIGSLAPDRLGTIYLSLADFAPAGGSLSGFSTIVAALTATGDGLHLDGTAPFAAADASDRGRDAFALGAGPATLAAWMPQTTVASVDVFGLQQAVLDLEAQLRAAPAFAAAADALNQLRALTALGLGINADRDLLPLFDGEAALAVLRLDPAAPRGVLLLRPSDPTAATAALRRMRDGLVERGATESTVASSGTTISILAVPGIGTVAYAQVAEVVLAGLDPADVAAALEAQARGQSLATDDRFTTSFAHAGAGTGSEFWVDLPSLLDATVGIIDPGSQLRDILHQIGDLAVRASAAGDHLEIHGVLTVR